MRNAGDNPYDLFVDRGDRFFCQIFEKFLLLPCKTLEIAGSLVVFFRRVVFTARVIGCILGNGEASPRTGREITGRIPVLVHNGSSR